MDFTLKNNGIKDILMEILQWEYAADILLVIFKWWYHGEVGMKIYIMISWELYSEKILREYKVSI